MQGIRAGGSEGALRVVVIVALMVAMAFALGNVQGAGAQVDPVSCGHFDTQADAQAALDSGDLDADGIHSLDRDGNGIACEEAFGLDSNSPPPARDYVSCGHFDTQADAQAALDSGDLDADGVHSLDPDGNGVACENAFGSSNVNTGNVGGPVALPNTGSGASISDSSDTWIGMVVGMSIASVCAAIMVRRSASGMSR